MRGMAGYLTDTEPAEQCDGIFVLGGNALDRGQEAARLYHEGMAEQVYCLGGNVPSVLEIIDTLIPECDFTSRVVTDYGVPPHLVQRVPEGTSTQEEAEIALRICREQGLTLIIVISENFHTRRVRNVFEEEFENTGIRVLVCGAASTRYKEETWWDSEEGMLMVNNEFMKLIYYWWKY